MNDTPNTTPSGDASPTHTNPPGLSALSYRTGTYATVRQRLIHRLATQHTENTDLPILQLDTRQRGNWLLGLLESWAMVVDILSFYQERIANEGYLRTATESRSIRELTGAIGYELRPGVSASTYLACIVRVGKDEPLRRCILPQGLAVQSVPTQGQRVVSLPEASTLPNQAQLPQVFETSATFEASSAWNTMKPREVATRPDRILPAGRTSLLLAGIKTGVRVGDPLLIVSGDTTSENQQRPWLFVQVETVEPNQKRGYTRLTWKEASGGSQPPVAIKNPTVYTFHQQAKLYPYARGGIYATPIASADWSPVSIGLPETALHTLIMPSTNSMLFAGTDNGVFRSTNNGETWEAASTGLLRMKIHALTVSDDGRLFAGSNTGHLFVSADNGTTWQMVLSRSTARRGLLALLPLPRRPRQALPQSIIRALASYRERNHSYLAAATTTGVYVSADGGNSWQQPPADNSAHATPRVAAWVFAAKCSGLKPLVGMDIGVFPIASPNWRRWFIPLTMLVLAISLLLLLVGTVAQLAAPIPAVGAIIFRYGFFEQLSFQLRQLPVPFSLLMSLAQIFQPSLLLLLLLLAVASAIALVIAIRTNQKPQSAHPLPVAPVTALAYSNDGMLLAASTTGLFRSSDQGLNWTQLPHAPEGTIEVITSGPHNDLYLGTREGKVYRSLNAGDTWEEFSQNLHLGSIQALAVGTNQLFAAGEPDSNDESGQWSPFQLAKKQINLDKIYTTILPHTRVVLTQGNHAASYAISSISTTANQDYKRSSSLTSLFVDSDAELASFSRLTTKVYVGSTTLDLFDDEPVQGDTIIFDRFVPDLHPGHRLIVSGKRMRVRLPEDVTKSATLLSTNGLQQQSLSSDSSFELLAAPVLPQHDGEAQWLLRDRGGFVGTLSAPISNVTYALAEDDDEVVSELVVIQSISADDQSSVTLSAPLRYVYDRSTVVIYGNVVQVTHGQTVRNEVLGSVDQQNKYHRFQLKQKPLSYLSAAAAEDDAPAQLTVMVNQVPWHRVPAFYDLGTSERAYMVRQDDREQTQIIFGNDSAGTPPPTGQEHITASYRFGSGNVGNVPANSLTQLRTRPPGLQSVTNPLPATGGVDPEAADEARFNAPRHIQTLQRIVSLTDYEQFARAFPGIGKVEVKKLWQGRTHLLLMTVAGKEETGEQANTALYQQLQDAIAATSVPPAHVISILPYIPVYFQLQVRLIIATDYALASQEIVAEVRQQVRNAFGFSQRQLGQGVSAAELILTIQQVSGIVAVEIEQLYIREQEPRFNTFLAATSGRLEGEIPQPAQLLLLDSANDDACTFQVEIQQS